MLIVTTLDYAQFGDFIKNRRISLDNADLVFGQEYEPIQNYLRDRLGSSGYVMGIRGRINEKSVELLSKLDKHLMRDKLILEVNVDDDEVLSFNVDGLEEAAQLLIYGLPDEMIYDSLDSAITADASKVQVVCVPFVARSGDVRITSLNRDVQLQVDGITFVSLGRNANGKG